MQSVISRTCLLCFVLASSGSCTPFSPQAGEQADGYSITVLTAGSGSIVKIPNKERYEQGEFVVLSASPNAGWAFNHWESDLDGTNPTVSLYMNGNKVITAIFSEDGSGAATGGSVTVNGTTYPLSEAEVEELGLNDDFNSYDIDIWLYFGAQPGGVYLDLNSPDTHLAEGIYYWNDTSRVPFSIVDGGFSLDGDDGYEATGGSATLSLVGDVYTLTFSLTLENGWVASGSYASTSNPEGEEDDDGGTDGPPNSPTNLVAVATSSSSISLSWWDNSDNELGFSINRSTSSTYGYVEVRTVGANQGSYLDTTLAADTTYYYRVYAYNSYGGYTATGPAYDSATTGSDDGGGTVNGAPQVTIREGNATVENGASQTFTADASDPDEDSLDYAWYIDNSRQYGETGGTLSVAKYPNTETEYQIRVEVTDGTLSDSDSVVLTVRAPGPAPLTSIEEELLGSWYRYHAYSGEYQYYIFNTDRTAYYVETTSGGTIVDDTCYASWELLNTSTSAVYTIKFTFAIGTTTDLDEYHYALDEIWKGGYSNLNMIRSYTTPSCPCTW